MKPNNTEQRICEMLQITPDFYNRALLESGRAKARELCCGVAVWAEALTACPAFWDWYTNQFYLQDDLFLRQYIVRESKGLRDAVLRLWLQSHRPEMLRAYPSREVYRKAEKLRKEAAV